MSTVFVIVLVLTSDIPLVLHAIYKLCQNVITFFNMRRINVECNMIILTCNLIRMHASLIIFHGGEGEIFTIKLDILSRQKCSGCFVFDRVSSIDTIFFCNSNQTFLFYLCFFNFMFK